MNDAVTTLLGQAEAHDGFPAISDQAVREARTGVRDIVTVGDDPLTAVGIIGAGELDLVVHPDKRGLGIGGALFDDLLSRARGDVRVWVHGDNPAGERLVTTRGFTPVRTLLRLELPGTELSGWTPADPLPDTLTLTTFNPDNSLHTSSLIEVNARAFHTHPEQGQFDANDLEATSQEPWFDPEDILMAWEADRLLGFSWIKTTRDEAGIVETELYVIGVDPSAAGRGLGTALLALTLERMAQHAPERTTLYVEGNNAPALALYRRAGFQTVQTSRHWLRKVAP